MVVGLVIRFTPGTLIQKSVSFDYQFFFNLLLPPIILASGYELHQVGHFASGFGGKGAELLTGFFKHRVTSFEILAVSLPSPSPVHLSLH